MKKILFFFLVAVAFIFTAMAQDKGRPPMPARVADRSDALFSTEGLSPSSAFLVHDLMMGKMSEKEIMEKYHFVEVNGAIEIPAFIRIEDEEVIPELERYGVRVKHSYGNLLTVQIPLGKFMELVRAKLCKNIDVGNEAKPTLDKARAETGVDDVYNSFGLGHGLDGTGVVVGIIDFGFEYGHPAFYDSTGTTLRIKRVWDQKAPAINPPNSFGYGNELDNPNDILAALHSSDGTTETHGTHVAGIAVGSGCSGDDGKGKDYRGVAPNADIVLVSLGFDNVIPYFDSVATTNTKIFDGIEYIREYAASVNKPCVINMSLGHHYGPHDGSSDFDEACDNLISSTPGVLLVGSAGNEGHRNNHISKIFSSSDPVLGTVLDFNGHSAGIGFINIWGSPNEPFAARLYIYNTQNGMNEDSSDIYLSTYTSCYSSTLTDADGQVMTAKIYCSNDNNNERHNICIEVDNSLQTSNNQRVVLAVSCMNDSVHAWAMNSSFTNGNNDYTISEIGGTGNSIISVGSYKTKICSEHLLSARGDISVFSSHGPTLDGRTKPDITAPGEIILASFNRFDNNYARKHVKASTTFNGNTEIYGYFEGTSMAAPFVTGILALCLQENPTLTYSQAIRLLHNTARTDSYTNANGSTPNNFWGWGKINVTGMIDSICVATPPYTEDFEENTSCWRVESAGWNNLWVIGSAANNTSDGSKALYISNDDGATNNYSTLVSSSVMAYRTLQLEARDYTVSFDWRANGEANNDYLRALLVPASEELSPNAWHSTLPANSIAVDGGSPLMQNTQWTTQTSTVTIPTAGEYKLVFFWNNDFFSGNNPAAAVDNIHIEDASPTLDFTVSTCGSYTWYETTYTESGDYQYSYTDENGDTIEKTLHLTIDDPVNTATTVTAGEMYTWHGTDYYFSGDYTYSHENANGCTQVDTLHLTISNPHDNIIEYWFDQYYDQHAVSMTSNTDWQMQLDVSSLDVGLHTLYMHLRDSEGHCSPPRTALFYKAFEISSEDNISMRYCYWFDQDYTPRQSVAFANGNTLADVSLLQDGLHTLNMLIGEGAAAELHSYLFYKVSYGDGTGYNMNYTCWFDQNLDNPQTGQFHNGILQLDVESLVDGLHTLNMLIGEGAAAELHNYLFYKIPYDGSSNFNYICWFDQNYDDRQTGPIHNGLLQLDVENLTGGLHSLNMQIGEGMDAELHSYVFYCVPRSALLSDTATLIYRYAIDGQQQTTLEVSPQNRLINLNLDVSNISAGLHSLAGCLMTSDSTSMALHTAYFYVVPLGGEGLCRYEYWYNDDFDNRTVVDISPVVDSFQLITLLQVAPQPINSNHFEFDPNGGEPVIYSQNSITFRFWNNYLRMSSATRQYVDERTMETVSADTLERNVTKYIATPGAGSIHWFKLAAGEGDSLSFRTDRRCTMQLYAPSGAMVMHASADSVLSWVGCHVWECGVYYLAVHDAEGGGNMNVIYHHFMNPNRIATTTVMACGSYTWHDTTYTTGGSFTRTVYDSDGCDSLLTLVLTVNPLPTVSISGDNTFCQGDNVLLTASGASTYSWSNGSSNAIISVGTAGTYTVIGTDANGCVGTDTKTVSVNPTYNVTDEQTICASQLPILWNGVEFTQAGTQSVTLQTVNNCDSVVNMTLFVNPIYNVTDEQTICASQLPILWNGIEFTQAGTQTVTLQTVNNCDSVVNMTLFVNPIYNVTDEQTICASELPILWNGVEFTQAGTQTVTLQTVNNCDSIVEMTLFVNPIYNVTDEQTICASELPILWNGVEFTQAGTQTVTLQTVNNCDSVVNMTLFVNPIYNVTDEQTICASELPILWNGIEFTQAGTQTVTLQTVNNCDSVVNMTLFVNPIYNVTDEQTICASELPILWNGVEFTQAGTQSVTLQTVNNCDSVVEMTLFVNPIYNVTDEQTICASELPILWNGVEFTQAGMQSVTLQTINNCDSVVNMTLFVNPIYNVTDVQTICASELPILWNGVEFTQAGTQTVTLQTVNNCDSVVNMTLIVNYTIAESVEITACDNYTWNNSVYFQSGDYTQVFTAANGCDSVVTLHLTVNYSNTGDTTAVACNSFDWYKYTNITQSGDYTRTVTNASGCDSVVTLHLTVNQTVTDTVEATTCDSYTWNDSVYFQSGDYMQVFTAANGCDSVVTLHLVVNYSNTGDTTAVACNSFDWYEQTNITQSGDYTRTVTNANDCDSIVTLHLTVNQTVTELVEATACDSYTWNDSVYFQSGDYTQAFTAANGCDSVVTLHLIVNYSNTGDTTAVACNSFDWYEQTNITQSGDYTHTFTNAAGCDSVVTLHLTVNYSNIGDTTAVACNSFDWYEYTNITQSGEYTHTFTNAAGCDSVVTLYLTVNYSNTGDTTAVACDSFDWYEQTNLTQSGDYTRTVTNASGCDSVVTLHLTVNSSVASTSSATACDSYEWNGQTYATSGDYEQTFTAANGCDSVVTLHLTINPSVTEEIEITTSDSCYTWNSQTYCSSGDYTQTLQTVYGCDSVVTLHLTVSVGVDDLDGFNFNLYPNPTTGIVNVECTMNNVQAGTIDFHVFDAYGKLVGVVETLQATSLQTDAHGSSVQTAQIDLSHYAVGVYFVKAVADGKVVAVRKVVKR